MNQQSLSIDEIFHEALQRRAATERDSFLDSACAGNAALRARIDQLLAAQSHVDSFLEAPAADPAPTLANQTELPGTMIGPYKLLEQIGEGGMGLVYMAEQQRPVRRLVALKIIKPGMDSKQVIARFEAERQALALMDHSNIARVLDAGTVEEVASGLWLEGGSKPKPALTTSTSHSAGRPYFVMELVRGIPINEFCQQKRLALRERLELFIQVCQAVQHAHQKGIIHRDLKPTNVLVTMHDVQAIPKVIDFGIAKALGQSLTDHTLHTGFAQLVGTPLYMSPEQAEMNALGVDTRSDVYSLGVMLYELLTGTTPFDKERLKSATFDEMRRIIREEEPETVSARLAKTSRVGSAHHPSTLNARSFGHSPPYNELDWIVMKALEKDRSRRYESASALAADIQRYLSDEPVLACPPTPMYRFQKFARKHKPALVTAAAIAVCLILGTTVSAWQAVRATTAEAQANANASQAQEKAQEANTQRDEAQKQRDEVRALNEQLQVAQAEQWRTLYAARTILAQRAWDSSDPQRVLELLNQQRPKAGQNDLRGFEWHYLYRLCHTELFTFKIGGTGGSIPGDRSLAFSPDSKRLASSTPDNAVKVWNVQTGAELLTLKGHTGVICCVAFSPDGTRLASSSATWDRTAVPGEIKIWDAQNGQELLSLAGHTDKVFSVAFSPDGKLLASASNDKTARIWDAQTGRQLHTPLGHTDMVVSVAFSPDGKRLATGGRGTSGRGTKIWDVQSGQEVHSMKEGGFSVTFSPDGSRLASAGGGRRVWVWDTQSWRELVAFDGAFGQTNSVAFSPDGKRLATGGGYPGNPDPTVKLWDSETGEKLSTLNGHTGSAILSIAFSPDGTRLASSGWDGTVRVWDVTADQGSRTFKYSHGAIHSVAFSSDGKRLAFGSSRNWDAAKQTTIDGDVVLCDAQTGQELLTCNGHAGSVTSVAFSPDAKRLASASADQTVKVWDAQTGKHLFTCEGHSAAVSAVAFSPDGNRLVSSSSVGTWGAARGRRDLAPELKVWDAQTGREILSIKGGGPRVAFSPDGKLLASGHGGAYWPNPGEVKVWDSNTGQEVLSLKGNMGGDVAFSPDGKRLASPSQDNTVRMWEIQSGQETLSLKGHSQPVKSVVFTPDGKRLLSVSADRTLKIWDSETGQELLTLNGRSNDVAFSPDGNRLASAVGGNVTIWDATPLPERP